MKMILAIAAGLLLSLRIGAEPILLGYWDFDDVSGRRLEDRSGNGHHGKIFGAPQPGPGISGTALRFNSNDDYVDFGAPIIPARDFSISVWVNCDDTAKQFFLGQYRYADPQRLDLAVREGCVRIQIDQLLDSPKVVEAGRWHHLAYTRAAEETKVYLDGVVVAQARLPADVLQSENLIIGKINVPKQDSFRFTGSIDELKVWKGAISHVEVRRTFERSRVARTPVKSREQPDRRR